MAKIYESFLSTIIPQGKNWVSFDPRSQTLSSEDSTWMVDRLEIPPVVEFFFLFDYTIELFWLFQNTSFVLSRKRENQIVVTIGTLLHHIHVEFLNKNALLAFHSVCYVLFRQERVSLKEKKFYGKTF